MAATVTGVSRTVAWAHLEVTRWARKKAARYAYIVAALSPNLRFGIHDNTVQNAIRGIVERVYAVEREGALHQPPRPRPGLFAWRLSSFKERLRRLLPPTSPWSVGEFLQTYSGRKKELYARAAEKVALRGISRRDASSKSFIKTEKLPLYKKGDPAPRLIHPRSPEYNVGVGVFLKKAEHLVYRAIDRIWGERTVLKGYSAERVAQIIRGKWLKYKKPCAVGLDASRFDQHISTDALRWEHSVYLDMFLPQHRSELARLLSYQLRTKCTACCVDGKIKYTVEGMRFSGDMNTALGNCLIMCAMVWQYAQERGVRCSLCNNGDDCQVIMEEADLDRFRRGLEGWFTEMGFTMKMEDPVSVLEQVEFCQFRPVFTEQGWVMVRNHRHSQAKDCMCIKPLDNSKFYDKWRLAVGQGGLSMTGGVPVQQEFYAAFMRGAKGKALERDSILDTGMSRLARGMARQYEVPSAAARVSYWRAFGVTPDQQIALEEEYKRIVPMYSLQHELNGAQPPWTTL